MSRREQALVDQMVAWRAEIDATPEPTWAPGPPAPLADREQRLADARARRADRVQRPAHADFGVEHDRQVAQMQPVVRLDTVITREDAEFAQWRRKKVAKTYGRSRGGRKR